MSFQKLEETRMFNTVERQINEIKNKTTLIKKMILLPKTLRFLPDFELLSLKCTVKRRYYEEL